MKQTTLYSANASEFPTLSEATWQEFSRFVSPFQWALDDPSHSPRSVEIAKAIKNKGQKGACTSYRENGEKVILRRLHAWVFEKAVHNRKIFYVSYGKLALLYFDIDLHYAWQTYEAGQEAQKLLTCLFPQLFWAESSRGFNGYLKVDLQGMAYHTANQVFDRSEKAVRRVLAYYKNLADFEIKGRIGHLQGDEYKWQQYGKLPIHANSWNFPRLNEFKSKATVSLVQLDRLCAQIEAQIPAEVLERHKHHKRSLGNAPLVKDDKFLVTPAMQKTLEEKYGEDWRCQWGWEHLWTGWDNEGGTWLPLCYYRPDGMPLTKSELKEKNHAKEEVQPTTVQEIVTPAAQRTEEAASHPVATADRFLRKDRGAAGKTTHQRRRYNLDLAELRDEPDSFERQKEAFFRLARSLKRIPTEQEALAFLQEERLFSGTWEDHLARRTVRVRSILNFIARTFDASKCAKGSVNVGKYDDWAKKSFPTGLQGRRSRSFAPDCTLIERPGVHVGTKFIAAFLAVCEFALLIDKNRDNTLPHNRAEQIWDSLHGKGLIPVPFCARKWSTCREEMVEYGIIQITNRHFGPGKAMEWALGSYFPFLGLWKSKKQPSLQGPVYFTQKKRRGEKEHNTLLHKQAAESAEMALVALSRPPP